MGKTKDPVRSQELSDSDDDLFVLVEKPKKKKEKPEKHRLFCKVCNTDFTSSSELIRHVKKTHNDNVVMVCAFCKVKFHERTSFNKHIRTHKK
ncbi:unnamed protein product [Orchesella dallaii]|uniref:C2H2-type domain-containing protein n=1 Tax=Orchesella dallaii TaxID=48710 RepID=A0ABP1QWY9_9HEXA